MMLGLRELHEYGEEIERRLRLRTFPIAVKLLEKEADIPEGAIRPKRDLGHHLSTCQGFAMSRREGTLVAMLKEDMWCFEPVIGYGLAELPQYFLDGYNRFPESVMTLEAGSSWARSFPHLETGKYIGILSGPLVTANFEPDLIMMYCQPGQLTLLIYGATCMDGHDIESTLSSHAACVYSVVPIIQTGKCQVTIPCCGDRQRGLAQDDELIFSVPLGVVENLLLALRYLDRYNRGLPYQFSMLPEYELSESYAKIGRMIGMDVD
ncbi:MAG: DUF169 domain-containing protein [Dehalococcoidia bacterium]|nr:DUF169 domain-containing protein [Dehalococcoidia bacterium]